MSNYNPAELTVIMGSRALQDGQLVFAGAGLPLLSAIHAQKMHAPSLSILFEVGGVAPRITSLPRSTNEARSVRRSVATPATIDMMLYLQRGFVDVGFLGGAQIDRHGNINSSCIGTLEKPKVRLPGSGGANDIASSANRVFIISYHEKRRFVEKVDFVTSPGFLEGGQAREKTGLLGGGVVVFKSSATSSSKPVFSRTSSSVMPGCTAASVMDRVFLSNSIIPKLVMTFSTPPPTNPVSSRA